MKLRIDTDQALSELRHHFGVNGVTSITALYSRKGRLTKIIINDTPVSSVDRFFSHLAILASAAKEEVEMEEEGSLIIGALRTLS